MDTVIACQSLPGDTRSPFCRRRSSPSVARRMPTSKAPLDTDFRLLVYRTVAFDSRSPRFRGPACEMFSPLRKAMLEALSVRGGYRHRLSKLAGRHPLAILSSAIFALGRAADADLESPARFRIPPFGISSHRVRASEPAFSGLGVLDVFAVAKGDARGALDARRRPAKAVAVADRPKRSPFGFSIVFFRFGAAIDIPGITAISSAFYHFASERILPIPSIALRIAGSAKSCRVRSSWWKLSSVVSNAPIQASQSKAPMRICPKAQPKLLDPQGLDTDIRI